QLVHVCIEERAELLHRKSFGGGVDREHLAAATVLLFGAEVHPLTWLQLASVEEPDVADDQQQVALVYRTVEKWLAWPGDFDHPARVSKHYLENPQPLPRGQHSLANHASEYGGVHPGFETVASRDRACVLVAARHVVEQVSGRADVQPRKQLRPSRADAREIHDRSIEIDATAGA